MKVDRVYKPLYDCAEVALYTASPQIILQHQFHQGGENIDKSGSDWRLSRDIQKKMVTCALSLWEVQLL